MVDLSREDILFLLLAVLAQAYLTPRLPELPEGGFVSILNDSTTQSLLMIAIIFVILHGAWTLGRNILTKDGDKGGQVGVEVFTGPPSSVLYTAVIRYGDVFWEGQFGTTRGSEITYVQGPYCPRCETELSLKIKQNRIRSNQKQWKCSSCGFTVSRETDSRDSQREIVEKILDNEADDAIQNLLAKDEDRIQDLISDILDKAADIEPKVESFLDKPNLQTMDEDVRDAVFDSIESKLDEETIRQDPTTRTVLRKTFGYTLSNENRNYAVVDEELNERKVRRATR